MKKVLVIAYGFPPVGGAGVQRPVKFVKYLRDFGWEPVVLTVLNPSVPLQDKSLLADIPPGVKIYKAKTLEPSYRKKQLVAEASQQEGVGSFFKKFVSSLLLPDIQILWWPYLAQVFISAIRTERPDCVFVTAPPFSSLLPSVILGRLFRVPVVIDFRDEWIFSRQNLEHTGKGFLVQTVDFYMERFVVKLCANFTAATDSYVKEICKRHPLKSKEKGVAITNGFDDSDFEGVYHAVGEKGRAHRKKRIIYAGTIWKATSLAPFFNAFAELLRKNRVIKDQIEVRILGRFVEDEKEWHNEACFDGMVHALGYVEHNKLIEEIMAADVLLLTLADLPGADRIIPGKTFEYIASGRNVLCLVPDGEVSDIMSNYPLAKVIHPNDKESIISAIESFVKSDSEFFGGDSGERFKFSRKKLTGDLVSVFESVAKSI